jgi:hypothetical protein
MADLSLAAEQGSTAPLAGMACPACGARRLSSFYEIRGVPVHSVLLLPSRSEALRYPTGHISLAFCESCGFIFNAAFKPGVHEYASRYEATQGFSPTFNTFQRRLAADLVERYDLHGKRIVEIGCGQAEFLELLCEMGGNEGIGFDPAFAPERSSRPITQSITGAFRFEGEPILPEECGIFRCRQRAASKDADSAPPPNLNAPSITIVKDFYSERYADCQADFICCKMTLEHIQPAADFVGAIRRSLSDRSRAVVFFQVPDVGRILHECAFWDIYYEHCSYFSLGSLARLFRRCGFDVLRLARDYDAQYLVIEARPAQWWNGARLDEENDLIELRRRVVYFAANYRKKLDRWRSGLWELQQRGQRVVLWGGGSKAVAFLTTLSIGDEVEFVVDINPRKHGIFLAGTGHQVVSPEFLRTYRPGVVILMNPIYRDEIAGELERMGLSTSVISV